MDPNGQFHGLTTPNEGVTAVLVKSVTVIGNECGGVTVVLVKIVTVIVAAVAVYGGHLHFWDTCFHGHAWRRVTTPCPQ